jgi:hypothetical protein
MSFTVIDENDVRKMPLEERMKFCTDIIKKEDDESKRWDAVWLAGEIAEVSDSNSQLFLQVSDLMVWVLENDTNGVVKHEACFQIAARNMRDKIPDLIKSALDDPSILVKHEAIESLGLMRAFEAEKDIEKASSHTNPDVRETARFVLKRFARMKYITTEYSTYNIL